MNDKPENNEEYEQLDEADNYVVAAENKRRNYCFFRGVAAGCIFTLLFVGGFGFGIRYQKSKKTTVLSDSMHLKKLELLEELVDTYYLEDKDEEELAEGIYTGLIYGLGDVYSRYYTAEEYQAASEDSEGEYQGIGILMKKQADGSVRVDKCYENSPCAQAGILEGDILVSVNGRPVEGMELTEIAVQVKNNEDDTLILGIQRQGEGELEISVPIGIVEMPTVESRMLENKVGYLSISEFKGVTLSQYEKNIKELESQGMERLIIDLRDNPGGLLTSVCDVLGQILPEGLIVYTEDKYGNKDERLCDGENPLEIPLAVLINENSASASEVFAGAVKDYGIGILVGKTTYGKGVVQTIRELTDGSAVKLTIAKYYTPSGKNIHQVGVEPDIEVEQSDDTEDMQLEKAIEAVKAIEF